jgi:hypothetical protein
MRAPRRRAALKIRDIKSPQFVYNNPGLGLRNAMVLRFLGDPWGSTLGGRTGFGYTLRRIPPRRIAPDAA